MSETERPRRRLPVLNNKEEDDVEERPAWHWVVLTAVASLLAWLLLASIANALGGSLAANAVALGSSAALGGAMTGRFGRRARGVHAVSGAIATAIFGCALAFRTLVASPVTFAITAVVASSIAAIGAAIGFSITRRRVRA